MSTRAARAEEELPSGVIQRVHTPVLKRLHSFERLVSMAGVAVERGAHGGPPCSRHAGRGHS